MHDVFFWRKGERRNGAVFAYRSQNALRIRGKEARRCCAHCIAFEFLEHVEFFSFEKKRIYINIFFKKNKINIL